MTNERLENLCLLVCHRTYCFVVHYFSYACHLIVLMFSHVRVIVLSFTAVAGGPWVALEHFSTRCTLRMIVVHIIFDEKLKIYSIKLLPPAKGLMFLTQSTGRSECYQQLVIAIRPMVGGSFRPVSLSSAGGTRASQWLRWWNGSVGLGMSPTVAAIRKRSS